MTGKTEYLAHTYQVQDTHRCPDCDRVMDAATGITEDAVPRDGDFSLCAYCGSVNRFFQGKLLKATEEEEKIIDPEQYRLLKIIQAKIRSDNSARN